MQSTQTLQWTMIVLVIFYIYQSLMKHKKISIILELLIVKAHKVFSAGAKKV